MPCTKSTTTSPVAKETISSWSVNGEEMQTFRGHVERIMKLLDVSRKQDHLVAGGLLIMGRLVATIGARNGLDRLTRALSTMSNEGLSQVSYYDEDEKGPMSPELARRGVGEAGTLAVSDSIWRLCVPADLLKQHQN